MRQSEPQTRNMKISDVKRNLSRVVNETAQQKSRVLIEKSGIPVAALVPVQDLEVLTRLEREMAARRRAIEAISVAFEDVPLEEIEVQLDRIAAEGPGRDDSELVRETAESIAKERQRRFAVIDQMREAFKDIPPEEIERDVVAIIREMREDNEAALRAAEEVAVERRPA